MEMLAKNFISS